MQRSNSYIFCLFEAADDTRWWTFDGWFVGIEAGHPLDLISEWVEDTVPSPDMSTVGHIFSNHSGDHLASINDRDEVMVNGKRVALIIKGQAFALDGRSLGCFVVPGGRSDRITGISNAFESYLAASAL